MATDDDLTDDLADFADAVVEKITATFTQMEAHIDNCHDCQRVIRQLMERADAGDPLGDPDLPGSNH